MIYALGCSFTKWHWNTWADWLSLYQKVPLKNLAHPGYTNSLIYYQLINLSSHLQKQDQVYIMWTGTNRTCQWYDRAWVEQQDCKDFFPDTNGRVWFTKDRPWTGLYKNHPNHIPSLSHMQIDTFNTILQTQLLLDRIGCNYYMMFWQNPWHDTREIFVPRYHSTWQNKHKLSQDEINQSDSILSLPVIQSLIREIDWNHFVCAPADPANANSYKGLWEYTLESKERVLLSHQTDRHPNALAQHDWAFEFFDCGSDPYLLQDARDMAIGYADVELPPHDRRKEIWHQVDH